MVLSYAYVPPFLPFLFVTGGRWSRIERRKREAQVRWVDRLAGPTPLVFRACRFIGTGDGVFTRPERNSCTQVHMKYEIACQGDAEQVRNVTGRLGWYTLCQSRLVTFLE